MAKRGGKRAGAGRKSRVIEQNLNALLQACVPGSKRESIIRKLAEDAEHPSFRIRNEARKVLLAYMYGKPVDRLEVSGEGGGPIPITIIEPVRPDA
jgi:hypothetical protein